MKHFEKVLSKRYARAYMMLDDGLSVKDVKNLAMSRVEAIRNLRDDTFPFKNILLHPLIPFTEKKEILRKVTKDISKKKVLNFAELLIKENRFHLLDSIIEESEKVLENYLGYVRADVVSIDNLTDAEVDRLKKVLSSLIKKEAVISQKSSKHIIGGIEIKIGDLMIDATVKSKLHALKKGILKGN